MNKILILSLFIATATCKLIIGNTTYRSAQLTPRGYDHPLFEPVTALLFFEGPDLSIDDYESNIIIAVAATETFVDDIIFRHISHGCAGTIIVGVNDVYPGDSVTVMRNQRSFAWDNGSIYPVTSVTSKDFESIRKQLNSSLLVTITSEENDNIWKYLGLSPIVLIMIIVNGLAHLAFIVWNCITLKLIVESGTFVKIRVTSVTTIINIVHSIFKIIGLINYNGFYQLYDSVSSATLTSINTPILFAACWINALIMHQIVDRHSLEVKSFLDKKYIWVFVSASIFHVVADVLTTGLYSGTYSNPFAPRYLSLVRISVTTALSLILAIVYTVGSVFILKALKSGPIKSKSKSDMVKKSTTLLFIISGSLFGYCITVALTFLFLSQPYAIIVVYLIFNLMLSLTSGTITYNNYSVVKGRMFISSRSTDRTSNQISLPTTTSANSSV